MGRSSGALGNHMSIFTAILAATYRRPKNLKYHRKPCTSVNLNIACIIVMFPKMEP